MKHLSPTAKGLAALALATPGALCFAAPVVATPVAYTAATAPDVYSRTVLQQAIGRIDAGATSPGDRALFVHRNFAQVIEQNFARLDAPAVALLISHLSDLELSHLAQLYTSARVDSGRQDMLLPILAQRLSGAALAKVSRHFGYEATYEAVARMAPQKLSEFDGLAIRTTRAPVPGAALVQRAGVHTDAGTGVGKWLDYTPTEIYLDMRTAPVGSLTVQGALFETTAVLAATTWASYNTGYEVGTVVGQLIQTYDPPLWDAIGGTVAVAVENIQNAGSLYSQGQYEASAGALFGLDYSATYNMQHWGGDYTSAYSWECFFDTW
jgi:hypothetical protein